MCLCEVVICRENGGQFPFDIDLQTIGLVFVDLFTVDCILSTIPTQELVFGMLVKQFQLEHMFKSNLFLKDCD